MHLGPEALKQAIKNADFYPVQGLFNFRNYFYEIDDYFYNRHGYELGISTGWRSVDEFYKVSQETFIIEHLYWYLEFQTMIASVDMY